MLFAFAIIIFLILIPNRFSQISYPNSERVAARILETDDTQIKDAGLARFGEQLCTLKILEGQFKGEMAQGTNLLTGKLEMDKVFLPGDKAFVVIDYSDDGITFINIIDHYRMDWELVLVVLFVGALVLFAGEVGVRAIIAFVITLLSVWKILIPAFLYGYNPILVACLITCFLTTMIIGLVYGPDRRALAAITGSLGGTLVTCLMALVFVSKFKIHGAIMSYSESLLYSGFENLNLTEIFTASIFVASSGALMDVAVDITSAVHELVEKNPGLSRKEAIKSGLNIGRSIMGTMTTTLLLAYSGGYIALLMVFMAQGTPLLNILNLKYVSSEILHTLLGSFGLVTVAPITAIVCGVLLTRQPHEALEVALSNE